MSYYVKKYIQCEYCKGTGWARRTPDSGIGFSCGCHNGYTEVMVKEEESGA